MRPPLPWYLNRAKLLQTHTRHITYQYPQLYEVKCLTTSFSEVSKKILISTICQFKILISSTCQFKILISTICQFLWCRYFSCVGFKLTTHYQPAPPIPEILKIQSRGIPTKRRSRVPDMFCLPTWEDS